MLTGCFSWRIVSNMMMAVKLSNRSEIAIADSAPILGNHHAPLRNCGNT
jgi:hypothetical protein